MNRMQMRGAAALGILALAVAASVGVVAQQGPGVQRGRPGAGRSPEFPVPSITDYKPRNTLKVPQHPTPKAKFPVIDIHSHQPTPISPEQFAKVVEGMNANNLRVLINLSGGFGANHKCRGVSIFHKFVEGTTIDGSKDLCLQLIAIGRLDLVLFLTELLKDCANGIQIELYIDIQEV